MMTGQERYDLVNSKHKCPVCGEYIFDGCYFDICPVWGWEENMVQFMEPDFAGGPNNISLNQARTEWQNERKGYPWTKEHEGNTLNHKTVINQ